jgi:penicillin-binding protein 1C
MSFRFIYYLYLILFLVWLSAVIVSPNLFRELDFSPVLYSHDHKLMAAKVSKDGQWRFPVSHNVSEKYISCLKVYEDKRFDYHIGIDPLSIARAIKQNISSGRIKSGGSTITMQLARLLLKNPPRTFWNKLKESWYAIGLEFNLSKKQILEYYSAIAPYGGNVVGIDAAIWRYFQRSSNQLSWAESALLTVLPNQPSFIHLDKNRSALLKKRNDLLEKLFNINMIDRETYELSLLEPVPQQIYAMPQSATLLLEQLIKKYPDQYHFTSTIDAAIQDKFIDISNRYAAQFRENEIHNLAILLVDNAKREVLSYIGNSEDTTGLAKNSKVNNIHTPRSSGSILKPILYAAALDRGLISTQTLLPDIPTLISGFRPENFSRMYSGAMPAQKCIQQSLNVPAVRLLQWYGVDLFYKKLIKLGFGNLFRPSEEYGLSLILGGAEVTAWDLAKIYSGFSNQLLSFNKIDSKECDWMFHDLKILKDDNSKILMQDCSPVISTGALYNMIQTMKGVELPELFATHFYLKNQRKIAWKTGTSFGFKDAWCVGLTPEYSMVVWVGNSSGLGRPGLIGVYTAAPLLFELFQSLRISGEWLQPFDEMHKVVVCRQSGYPPSKYCSEYDTLWLPSKLEEMTICPFHQQVYLDASMQYRVFKDCDYSAASYNWFSLPPVMEYYFKPNHPDYKVIPQIRKDCLKHETSTGKAIEFIYPDKGIEVYIPVDLDELPNKIVLKAAHKNEESTIHWFMDNSYLGSTSKGQHEWLIEPSIGVHYLKIADDSGQSANATINCFRKSH